MLLFSSTPTYQSIFYLHLFKPVAQTHSLVLAHIAECIYEYQPSLTLLFKRYIENLQMRNDKNFLLYHIILNTLCKYSCNCNMQYFALPKLMMMPMQILYYHNSYKGYLKT